MPTQNDSTMTVVTTRIEPRRGPFPRQRPWSPPKSNGGRIRVGIVGLREGRRPPCRLRPSPSRDGAPGHLRHQPSTGRASGPASTSRPTTTTWSATTSMPSSSVLITTPRRRRRGGLEAGKHVFCEKPPGRCVADVERIQSAERASRGRKLKFGFNHRYHGSVMEAKQIVDSGRYGRVLWLRGVYGKCGEHPVRERVAERPQHRRRRHPPRPGDPYARPLPVFLRGFRPGQEPGHHRRSGRYPSRTTRSPS